jgi:hypothetical protein
VSAGSARRRLEGLGNYGILVAEPADGEMGTVGTGENMPVVLTIGLTIWSYQLGLLVGFAKFAVG